MKRIAIFSIILALATACGGNNDKTDLTAEELRDSLEQAPAPETVIVERNHTQVVREPARAQQSSAAEANSSDETTTPEEKKRMSNTAKGALIGAGAGIITGAVVSKKDRAKGAVIGGVIGTAAGAATGAILDKKKRQQEEE